MKLLNTLLIISGFLCVGIGTIGIFAPILPTTPFYLLATLCFAKGSERFHTWFTNTKLYQKHLESYAKSRSMTLKTKLSILIPVSIMLILVALSVNSLVMRVGIIALLLIKYWYFIFKIKTLKPNEQNN